MKKVLKAVNKITKFEAMVLGAIFLVLTFLVFAQIVVRTFHWGNIVWLDELCRVVLIDTAFIAACVALTQDHLISLTLITDMLSCRVKNAIAVVTNLIGAVFCVWVGIHGWSQMLSMVITDVRTVTLGIPYWLTYLPISVAFFGMAIRFLLLTYCNVMWVIRPEQAAELTEQE